MIAPLLLAAALAAPAAPAAPAAEGAATPLRSDKPVRVDADEVRFSWKTRQVTVVGKPFVTLTHDDATLTCRRLTGENDAAGRLRVATCISEVKLVRGARVVTCERATYDREAARVVCTGNPVLRDEDGTEARGEKLTYDLGADEVRLEGAAQVTVPGSQLEPAAGAGKRSPGGAAPRPEGGR